MQMFTPFQQQQQQESYISLWSPLQLWGLSGLTAYQPLPSVSLSVSMWPPPASSLQSAQHSDLQHNNYNTTLQLKLLKENKTNFENGLISSFLTEFLVNILSYSEILLSKLFHDCRNKLMVHV